MNDREFMLHAFKGNQAAVDYVLAISRVVDVWDNLIDKDVPVSDEQINSAFFALMVEIPSNEFFLACREKLLPLHVTGIANWLIANRMEKSDEIRSLEIAHVIRYSIADVAVMAAVLCGGYQWAEEIGPELRMRSQRSDFNEYMKSLNREKP